LYNFAFLEIICVKNMLTHSFRISAKCILALFLLSFVLPFIARGSSPELLDGDPEGPQNLIRLKMVGGLGADETIVYFDQQATDNYDPNFDAVKMLSGNPGVPNIYSRIGEDDFSINVMGAFNADKSIPIIMNITRNGVYTVTVVELKYLEPTTMVYLEDRLQNKFYNLRLETVLNFNFTSAMIQNRFFLHYKVPVQFSTVNETCRQNDGVVKFNNPSDNPWDVTLLSADGLTQLATAPAIIGEHLFVGLDGGNYNLSVVKATDGYSQMIPVSISSALALDPGFSAPQEPVMTGAPAQFVANQTGENLTYNWDMGDGTLLTGSSTVEHFYTAPGVYTITLLLGDGTCSDASQFSLVVLPDVVTNITILDSQNPELFELYPNPVKDILTIRVSENLNEPVQWMSITDLQGRVVRRELVEGLLSPKENFSIALGHLSSGSYFLSLTGKSKNMVKPFVIRH
jgi:hypothetical protein